MTALDTKTLQLFVEHQQRRHHDELGFLPRLAIKEYNARGQIIPATQNGELASYALFFDGRNGKRPRNHPDTIKIHQLCTDYQARNLHLATSLINQLITRATATGFHQLAAWVATDIDANDFWSTIGFTLAAQRIGGHKRQRIHNLWLLNV